MNTAITDLAAPRNASELHYLATATPGMPTLAARSEALATLHALGRTLPDTTADAASRAAWSRRDALAAQTGKPTPRPTQPGRPIPQPPRPRPVGSATTKPAGSYADRLRAALADHRLTPAARAGIEAELAGIH